ncbi:galactitol-1-phosphate 5-dehydrogenase [Oleiharenicola lentus]|uniref:Galactitol-1-phosphate 5-dehydrogenase n=1 Tax=Oleiharenicola lentus TaxID=2508720 RepID=A0A4Q1CDA1_9BACT|nr:galactitol-1-phosphate 5-dehydrogenase [Oleiharenicola lentus]RXK56951.1 galactitol-1-phosphate 5-dehydrogenase [Oleiharenicola lentus]
MQALILTDAMRFNLEDIPTPKPGPGEVLVAIKACGICGSDVHGMDGSTGRRRPPIVMGHEAAGTIAAVGPGVTAWQADERVTFDSTIYCGQCEHCRRGEVNLCHHRRVLGVSCEDYRQPGAFADYVVVPERILYRLPENLSFAEAALIEPFTIAFHAVRRHAAQLNDSALIIGCGMIGLALLQTARLAGYGRIVAVDTAHDRLQQARNLGVDDAVNSADGHSLDVLLKLTGGRGFDHVFEAVGVAATVDLALRAARKGGGVTLVGNVTPQVPLPLQVVVTRELSIYGSCASAGEYPACLDMMARGKISAKPLLSAVAPLREGPAWFDRLYRREPGLLKVILTPDAAS